MSNQPSVFTKSILRSIHSQKPYKPSPSKNTNQLNADANGSDREQLTVNGKPFPKLSLLNRIESESNAFESKIMREINDFDLSLLLHMALTKIPAIPFQYLMDTFRWSLFNGTVAMNDANALFWNLAMDLQGIHPPDWKDRRDYFDLGAKFHTSDNTPFTRYEYVHLMPTAAGHNRFIFVC